MPRSRPGHPGRGGSRGAAVLLPLLLLAGAASGEPRGKWSVTARLGAGRADGGYGEFLKEPYFLETSLARQSRGGAWRFGAGLQFGSLAMSPPFGQQDEWARLETFITAARYLGNPDGARPYVLGRLGVVRVHPRSELFFTGDLADLEPGESPTRPVNGVGGLLGAGLEVPLAGSLSFDVSGTWSPYRTGTYDLAPIARGSVDAGSETAVRAGLVWKPLRSAPAREERVVLDPETGRPLPQPPADGERDAWGVRRSWGWATAEMLGINFGASMINEYVRNANFNQVSPRSYHENLKEGFTWDDNKFATNQLVHPFNGSTYHNAARANGLGFWGSSAMAMAGAFAWEAFGETHPMSYNDMVSTGLGGIARGETGYRISSMILDNTSRGGGRFAREVAAGVVNPVRGFNRLLRGEMTRVHGNPSDPQDRRPRALGMSLRVGGRAMSEGESLGDDVRYFAFAQFTLSYGSAWDNRRRHPYDRFDLWADAVSSDKNTLPRLLIRGDVLSFPIGDGTRHSFAVQQDFDYVDNEAYEYGGQSLGFALQSRFPLHRDWQVWTRLQAYGIVLGAVNSELALLANVADRERFREYDYGPGLGGASEMYVLFRNHSFLAVQYRYSYLDVSNGSVFNDPASGFDIGAAHRVKQFFAALDVPVNDAVAVGVSVAAFHRRSEYYVKGLAAEGLPDGTYVLGQRTPEARAFLSRRW